MVTLGKLNMDEFAMGSTNEYSYYGAVSNPWDLERVQEVHQVAQLQQLLQVLRL